LFIRGEGGRWVKGLWGWGGGAGVAVAPEVQEPVPLTPLERPWSMAEGRAETEKVEAMETAWLGACRAEAEVEPEVPQQVPKLSEEPVHLVRSSSHRRVSRVWLLLWRRLFMETRIWLA